MFKLGRKNDFDLLKGEFIKIFAKIIDPVQINSEIFQMKQKVNQSVREFVHEVQTKAKIGNISSENILSAVNGGLLSHIRADLRRNPPSSLEELIQTAELSESAYAVHPPQMNITPAALTDMFQNLTGGVNMLELKQSIEELKTQTIFNVEKHSFQPRNSNNKQFSHNNRSNLAQNSKPKCKFCGSSKPHDFGSCSARNKTCYNCNSVGHIRSARKKPSFQNKN